MDQRGAAPADPFAVTLEEMRRLLSRVEQQQLEAGDWSTLDSLVSEFIDEAGAREDTPAESASAGVSGEGDTSNLREPG